MFDPDDKIYLNIVLFLYLQNENYNHKTNEYFKLFWVIIFLETKLIMLTGVL